MTDQFGRPLERPQTKSSADALARKYAEGHLPTNKDLGVNRQHEQFDESSGDYYRDSARVDEIYDRLMRDTPSSDEQ